MSLSRCDTLVLSSRFQFNKNGYETFRDLLLEMVRNRELRRTYDKLGKVYSDDIQTLEELSKSGDLSSEELAMFRNHQLAFWNYRVETIEQLDNLTTAQRRDFENGIRRIYGSSPARLWYQSVKETMSSPDVVEYIDDVLSQGKLPHLYRVGETEGT